MTDENRLMQCAGYRVDTHDGRIGSIAAVLPRAGRRERSVLLVHSGLLTCTLTEILFDDVETVDADRRCVVLRESPERLREGARSSACDRVAGGA